MSDALNGAFQKYLHPSSNENERSVAHSALLRMIGNKQVRLIFVDHNPDQDEITRLQKELNTEKKKVFELYGKLQSWHDQLETLSDALQHQTINRQRSKGLANAESFIIDRLLEHPEGVSKRELLEECSSSEERQSIHRRWSEAKRYHFLIKSERGDEVMVHKQFRDRYPKEWEQYEAESLLRDIERKELSNV